MRHSVFLAVWLCLVLSLLKETTAAESSSSKTGTQKNPTENSTVKTITPGNTTVPAPRNPAENGTANTTTPGNTTVPTPPNPAENGTANTTTPGNTTVPTTPNPAENSTANTTAPGNTTVPTTPNPAENSTANTTTPGNTTVPTPPNPTENGTANTTAPGNTTVPTTPNPAENGTVNATTPDTIVTPSPEPSVDFCRDHPCGRNLAKCVSLKSKYACECPYGYYYSNENCHGGKTYPATIALRAPYSDSLQFVNSTEYEEVFNNITAFFKNALGNLTGYMQTAIVEIRSPKQSRNPAPLNVSVTNLFTLNSNADVTLVNSTVQEAINREGQNKSYVYSFKEAEHCDVYLCDTQTTECHGKDFPECKCRPGLEKTEWDDRSCSVCSKNCSAEAHKYCVIEKTGPRCKCLTNFREESEKCVACAVGYSGEECKDNSELILIIVGTVFGAIILSLVITVSIISVRAKEKRNPEKRSLIKTEYSNTNSSDRPSMFPRVQTTSGHANPGYQSNNPYEMRSTNRDNFPERDYDDLYEVSREPRGFRMQSRY